MASSSPLSEPPSSPPRTPSRDRSRKRGSYDPSTPRTARRLRSTTPRPGPVTARSPGREESKGKGKEVVTPLTLKNCGPLVTNVITHLSGQPIAGGDDEYEDYDEDSDSDESEQTSPTPCKDVRNTSEYFGLISYIYDESNRSYHQLICISFL